MAGRSDPPRDDPPPELASATRRRIPRSQAGVPSRPDPPAGRFSEVAKARPAANTTPCRGRHAESQQPRPARRDVADGSVVLALARRVLLLPARTVGIVRLVVARRAIHRARARRVRLWRDVAGRQRDPCRLGRRGRRVSHRRVGGRLVARGRSRLRRRPGRWARPRGRCRFGGRRGRRFDGRLGCWGGRGLRRPGRHVRSRPGCRFGGRRGAVRRRSRLRRRHGSRGDRRRCRTLGRRHGRRRG